MAIASVIIDSREPDWVQRLDFGVPAAVTALDAGDLWVATTDAQTLIIERKTPTDLLNTIKADRLFQQVIGMRQRSQWCC